MSAPMVLAHVLSSFGLGAQERVARDVARLPPEHQSMERMAIDYGALNGRTLANRIAN